MQKRYEFKVRRVGGVPFFIGTILVGILVAGLIVLLMTVGLTALVIGAGVSVVAGLGLAVRRLLGLGGRTRDEVEMERREMEFFEAERESRPLDLGEGEVIDVEVEKMEDGEE